LNIPIRLLACLAATVSFGVLLRQPPRTLHISALIGIAGYALLQLFGETVVAYFAAALAAGILCECAARLKKKTATLFLTTALIPLVPGLGLYRTMLYIVQEQYSAAAATGVHTLLGIFAIALAITVSTLIFTDLSARPVRKRSRGTYSFQD
jgi:uncharacterized membrane protein YjjB (DUF3815 family)